MYVCVWHILTYDFTDNKLFAKSFSLCHRYCTSNVVVLTEIGVVPDPAIMNLGNDKSVTRGIGVNAKESQKLIILIDDVGRNLFFDDFAEEAVRHGDILAYSRLCAIDVSQ